RNWYVDEPSCGGEVCVVLYHQPSAPPGVGGPYMFQWNDDRCNMKNNFICKYSLGNDEGVEYLNISRRRSVATEAWRPELPEERRRKGANGTAVGAKEPVQSLAYILISSIPVLLLLVAITGISCFWLFLRSAWLDVTPKGDSAWLPQPRRDSPKLDIYRVINKQSEADLAGARPGTKNSSFRAREGLESPRDTSSSALGTLASTESGFVTNDIYELCGDRVGRSKESTWVDNEIYGY
ncbi:LAYN protein, partial [Illadopsis cleaveri]|nr:LAYN protein [Illadopsis cleaveri]